MRLPISKQIELSPFSLEEEYDKLRRLFCDNDAFCSNPFCPLEQEHISYFYLLEHMFLQWELRRSFISAEGMMVSLQISNWDFQTAISEDRLLDYIQFVLNAIEFVDQRNGTDRVVMEKNNRIIKKAIKENCLFVFERLNAELKKEQSELYVVYKNDVASAVSIQQPKLEASIVDYLRIDNRDNIQRKREILCGLSTILEPHKGLLNNDNGFKLFDSTSFLLNNAGIRHAFKPDNRIHAKFQAMNKDDLIKWYDRTFQMILACVAEMPYLEFRDEIMELKDKNKPSSQ